MDIVEQNHVISVSEEQRDLMTELINIGVGRAASSLSQLLETRIELAVPGLEFCKKFPGSFQDRCKDATIVLQNFTGSIAGESGLMFDRPSGLKLTSLLSGLDQTAEDFDFEMEGILLEIGNVVLNGVLGSISNALNTQLQYTVPELYVSGLVESQLLGETAGETTLMLAHVSFVVAESDIEGSIIMAFNLGSVETIVNTILMD